MPRPPQLSRDAGAGGAHALAELDRRANHRRHLAAARTSWRFLAATGCWLVVPASAAPLAAPSRESPAPSEIMRPGMTFRGLVFPLNPLDAEDHQVLMADQAEIRQPCDLLRITGLHLYSRHPLKPFDLQASAAVYDLGSRTIETKSGFRADGLGLHFEGTELRGAPKSLRFDIAGYFEVRVEGLVPPARHSRESAPGQRSPFDFPPLKASTFEPTGDLTALGLLQEFSGNLQTFVRCSKSLDDPDPNQRDRPTPRFTVACPTGGWLDFRQFEMRLPGKSAVLAPRAILVSAGGIEMRRELPDGEPLIRMTGQGGIRAWMHPPQSGETWIRSSSFDYLSDRQLMQFEGGPLTVSRNGVRLEATEPWQFVRVFEGRRIVLSPGSWNMVGSFSASGD